MSVHSGEDSREDSRLDSRHHVLWTALTLALGAAVSLGLARFSYAMLLPPMRSDLGWTYFVAGAMNALNALGYMVGAWASPRWMRRWGVHSTLVGGGSVAAVALALHGLTQDTLLLAGLRGLTGMASAAMFVAGGVLAARLSVRPVQGPSLSPGLVLGIFYGGVGLGIVASALLVPVLPAALGLVSWQTGWLALGTLAALATVTLQRQLTSLMPSLKDESLAAPTSGEVPALRLALVFAPGLAAYFMFGLGYIGYMTFIVTLLREQHFSVEVVSAFYAVLGVGVMASPWIWAGWLQRHRGGQTLALLSLLLALATVIPVLLPDVFWSFVSGGLFGAVFLSVVASTTALVRHNLPPSQWPTGISVFTLVFAWGQVMGPALVGFLADSAGGLRTGLALSAAVLALGAVVATRQRAL